MALKRRKGFPENEEEWFQKVVRMLSLHPAPLPPQLCTPVCDCYVQVSTSVIKMMLFMENVGGGAVGNGEKELGHSDLELEK